MKVNEDMNECIIGIGSNINPENNIKDSLMILEREVQVKGVSSWVKIRL